MSEISRNLVDELLTAAQEVVNGAEHDARTLGKSNEDRVVLVGLEEMVRLQAVVKAISDEAVKQIEEARALSAYHPDFSGTCPTCGQAFRSVVVDHDANPTS